MSVACIIHTGQRPNFGRGLRAAFLGFVIASGAVAWPGELPQGIAPATVGVHLGTWHMGDAGAPRAGWQNVNPGLYARWSNGVTAGFYRNSLDRESAYLAWTLADRADRFALTVGAVSGYNGGVKPLLAPSVRLGLSDHASLRLTLLAAPKASPALHASMEYILK